MICVIWLHLTRRTCWRLTEATLASSFHSPGLWSLLVASSKYTWKSLMYLHYDWRFVRTWVIKLWTPLFQKISSHWPNRVCNVKTLSYAVPRWCAPPLTRARASRRSGPRWSRTEIPCCPEVNCRASGRRSRRFGCGAWSKRTSCAISRITPPSGRTCPDWRRGSPVGPSPQAWPLTCCWKPSHRSRFRSRARYTDHC